MTTIIPAECHSDDRVVASSFDAALWFEQATDKEILALANCGWGGDYPADEVAIFMADSDANVQKLFAYLEIREDGGFECHVDEVHATKWLAKHRPDLFKALQE